MTCEGPPESQVFFSHLTLSQKRTISYKFVQFHSVSSKGENLSWPTTRLLNLRFKFLNLTLTQNPCGEIWICTQKNQLASTSHSTRRLESTCVAKECKCGCGFVSLYLYKSMYLSLCECTECKSLDRLSAQKPTMYSTHLALHITGWACHWCAERNLVFLFLPFAIGSVCI